VQKKLGEESEVSRAEGGEVREGDRRYQKGGHSRL